MLEAVSLISLNSKRKSSAITLFRLKILDKFATYCYLAQVEALSHLSASAFQLSDYQRMNVLKFDWRRFFLKFNQTVKQLCR